MKPRLSIIIPNYNGASKLGACLEAVSLLLDESIELVVVDDASTDNSIALISQYPCKLLRLPNHSGASHARNIGAAHSQGEWLFFTDADCLLSRPALSLLKQLMTETEDNTVVGGSYSLQPVDNRFYSRFQSVFIHYSETRRPEAPDYLATHAMLIRATTFRESGGFAEDIGPILEDVEFSHRLRRAGIGLKIIPALQVQHIFNYSLSGSWRNAIRKTRYWVQYSLKNHDLFCDSGTASLPLKLNVVSFYLVLGLLALSVLGVPGMLPLIALLAGVNVLLNHGLCQTLYRNLGNRRDGIGGILYYLCIYPLPIGVGIVLGLAAYVQDTGGD